MRFGSCYGIQEHVFDVIAKLLAWWLRVHQNRIKNPMKIIMALQASNPLRHDRSQLICTNPKSNRHEHTGPEEGRRTNFYPVLEKGG